MSKVLSWCILWLAVIAISGCSRSVKSEEMYGVWKYIQVENPNQGTITPAEEIEVNEPSIRFSPGNKLKMIWGGKVLSEGTYRIAYPVIEYRENLNEKGSRDIKFLIKKFEDNILVFQTMEADAVRVTARKVN